MRDQFQVPVFVDPLHEWLDRTHSATIARRMKACVPWRSNLPWREELNIQAATWPKWSLFDVEPSANVHVGDLPDTHRVLSARGRYAYVEKVLPAGMTLDVLQGSRRGSVLFNGDVKIPCLFERSTRGFSHKPWMSITPMEVMTLRIGTRFAKGHTVLAGLGLGWQLSRVLAKRSVTKVTLVERNQELIDWILGTGTHRPHWREGTELEIICGDAYEVLPKLKADVALIDIFGGYGNNADDWTVKTPGIMKTWLWGGAKLARRRF